MRLNFFDHRTLFWTQSFQFYSNCAHYWWLCSILAINGDEIKKMDWANYFGQVYTYFQQSIWTFSNTEHCFGDQIVNFSPIVLIFGVQAQI